MSECPMYNRTWVNSASKSSQKRAFMGLIWQITENRIGHARGPVHIPPFSYINEEVGVSKTKFKEKRHWVCSTHVSKECSANFKICYYRICIANFCSIFSIRVSKLDRLIGGIKILFINKHTNHATLTNLIFNPPYSSLENVEDDG